VTAALDGIFLARPETVSDGIPLAVKDLLDTEGLTTTYGSAVFAEHVPARTAEAVRRLEAAGYVNVGKTNLHEFAYGITSENPHFGTVPNPIAPGRIAGGSSGGSAAALAAGLADAALGTDSGGSIRIPAACCGVVGFKPTFDLVPTDGCFPLAPSFDTVGPMARDVETCTTMLEILAPGFTTEELHSLDHVSVVVVWLASADPLVHERVDAAASLFGARRDADLPIPDVSAAFQREVADVHRELFAENADLYSDDLAWKIERCLAVSDAEATAARLRREEWRERCEELLDTHDLLVTPTIPVVAPRVGIGDRKLRDQLTRNTLPVNALGWPALALPCGAGEKGLPASIQLVGRAGTDAFILAAAKKLASLLRGTAVA
jgi:Asp-tRNA(Asn)/Glu-tRNA(Gln) amidotransferase A subunit family amidase